MSQSAGWAEVDLIFTDQRQTMCGGVVVGLWVTVQLELLFVDFYKEQGKQPNHIFTIMTGVNILSQNILKIRYSKTDATCHCSLKFEKSRKSFEPSQKTELCRLQRCV